MRDCLNCNEALVEGAEYCLRCGQRAHLHRLTFSHLFHEAIHFFTHADKGIFFTLRELTVRPGKVVREYIYGKRRKYFPPLNLMLILAGLYVFSLSLFTPPYQVQYTNALRQQVDAIKDETKRKIAAARVARSEKVQNGVTKYSNILFMLASPLLGWVMWLFYRRGTINYTEHVVANLYFVAYTSLFMTLLIAPLNYLLNNPIVFYLLLLVYLIFEIGYRTMAYSQMMEARSVRGKLKAFVASFVLVVVYLFVSYFILFNYIRSGLWGLVEK